MIYFPFSSLPVAGLCALIPGGHWVCVFPQELCSRTCCPCGRAVHPMRKIGAVCCGCHWAAQQREGCLAAPGAAGPAEPRGRRGCAECSAVGLERGAGPRHVLCLHQMESSGVLAPGPGSWGSSLTAGSVEPSSSGVTEVPELWQGAASLLPGLEMPPEDQDSVVVTEEAVLMLTIPQPIQRSPVSRFGSCPSLCSSLSGAHLVLQLAELWD